MFRSRNLSNLTTFSKDFLYENANHHIDSEDEQILKDKVKKFGFLNMIACNLLLAVFMVFIVWEKIEQQRWICLIYQPLSCFIIGVSFALMYIMSQKYKAFSLVYGITVSFVQALTIEGSYWGYIDNVGITDSLFLYLMGLAALSKLMYCKKQQLIFQILFVLYTIIRSWYYFQYVYPYLRYLTLLVFGNAFIYFMSRDAMERDREIFLQKNNKKKLLKLFHTLIKSHHDGITITYGEEILYFNQQSVKIFSTDQNVIIDESQKALDLVAQTCPIEAQNIRNRMIKRMQSYKVKIEKIHSSIRTTATNNQVALDDEENKHLSLWDYIQNFNLSYQVGLLRCRNIDWNENALYFKERQKSAQQQDSKRLQVFSNIIDNENQLFVVTTIRDMSHWIELERQRHISLAKTLAFASAAHEFRNPLGAMINSLELMKNYIDMSMAEKYFFTAKNCADIMLYLVNDIIDYGQIESNSIIINSQKVNLGNLMQECIQILKFRADLKGIEVKLDFQQEFPIEIETDIGRVKQILINLLSNAIKFTNVGYVLLSCHTNGSINGIEQSDGNIYLEVQDTGLGIEQTEMPTLFQAFSKNLKKRYVNQQGSGLGLLISKNLAKALNGDILVKSNSPQQGSTFTLVLPYLSKKQNTDKLSYLFEKSNEEESQINEDQHQEETQFMDYNVTEEEEISNKNNKLNQGPKRMRLLKTNEPCAEFDTPPRITTKSVMYDYSFDSLHWNKVSQKYRQDILEDQKDAMVNFYSQSYKSIQIQSNDQFPIQSEPLYQCECSQVLIVDDDPFNIIALEGMLNQLNITQVEKCFDGQSALNKITINLKSDPISTFDDLEIQKHRLCEHHRPYRLILIDNQMPLLTGFQVIQKVRSEYQDIITKYGVKIIMISGDYDLIENREYQRAFDYLLQKPLSFLKLKDILKRIGFNQ
ncbi:multi-sensor hybrid histidine kinase [Stylonychia lemnae]|uniref:Multi-sensor hybrid histidine kinase n=1 Tax=Stylonychia lemnae TaxID=5949 RepID=A0A078AZX0_STYLE|nr:multi-sensor hybrid histidine kinase [Stylonychia lemnae]|eukprot:CDW87789.1 multi-sensor hybrid histidine kinase [Stylonychia lemnae]